MGRLRVGSVTGSDQLMPTTHGVNVVLTSRDKGDVGSSAIDELHTNSTGIR